MADPKPPIDHVAIRRRAAETYDISIGMAAQHLAEAEKPNSELSTASDYTPTQAAESRKATHLRFAEVYALLARACQKIPGSQF